MPYCKWADREAALRLGLNLNYHFFNFLCFLLCLVITSGRCHTLDALNIHLKKGSSANAFWMHATAAGMSAVVTGRISIAILNQLEIIIII